ncbi:MULTISPECIES: hypothetical protein [unclassified Bradyrhizobium]|uniref:hypothetical protein n=1 Tax=Bradyrhizobium sp. USDA 4541 TaxID=2817704 RepID=UPI0020A5DD11|nr:hypothetical protein [Bradyrhizobium sp. USDA 4541]MCP1852744.1 hypothetical protein [Bradyrhizobium sp. USDA 4541]
MKRFIAETGKRLHSEKMLFRRAGFVARRYGEPISACPTNLGGFPNVHWLEGYAGKIAPSRDVIDGAFNMTPAEHVVAFTDWTYSLGLPAEMAAKLVAGVRSGYRTDVLPIVQ